MAWDILEVDCYIASPVWMENLVWNEIIKIVFVKRQSKSLLIVSGKLGNHTRNTLVRPYYHA